jgi:hypothetical protein
MKDNITVALCLIPCVTSSIIAGYLCLNSVDGWGWFVALSVFILPRIKVS